ncbi:ester cyclase, partial [Chloroflexota bacterium]
LSKPKQIQETNRITATRFIEAFNSNNWDTVREVVASDYVLHHPIGGTIQAGPEGMVQVWSSFKAALPDSWHPIPVMVAEGDYLAVLLPTYGHFAGVPYHGIAPTNKWLEYGMVNMVRIENDKISEAWFGMDSLAETQQMGAAPPLPPRELSETEKTNIGLFQQIVNKDNKEYDNLTAFDDVVVALSPPQYEKDTTARDLKIYRIANGALELIRANHMRTNPPYSGNPNTDTEESRTLVEHWFRDVSTNHDLESLNTMALAEILIHKTAMPCEASYYGIDGVKTWLVEQWSSFPNLGIMEYFTLAQGDIVVARWKARGKSEGNFLILPPTGKTVEYTGVSMYRIEEGKIAEIWETRNTLGIMQQLNPELRSHSHGQ